MLLPFGKYRGQPLESVPASYLYWLANPLVMDKETGAWREYAIPEEIRSEAKRLLDAIEYPKNRLAGMPGDKTEYILEASSSSRTIHKVFQSLDEALEEKKHYPQCLLWEVLPSGHKKLCESQIVVTLEGDIAARHGLAMFGQGVWQTFDTLEEALAAIEALVVEEEDGERIITADPEDDRIIVWEVLPSGHKKAVWQFCGWHYDMDEFWGLGQGALPGHEMSLYEEAQL